MKFIYLLLFIPLFACGEETKSKEQETEDQLAKIHEIHFTPISECERLSPIGIKCTGGINIDEPDADGVMVGSKAICVSDWKVQITCITTTTRKKFKPDTGKYLSVGRDQNTGELCVYKSEDAIQQNEKLGCF